MDKLDYKKEYKELYQPKQKPMVIDVPEMTFFMVDGQGAPEGDNYQEAISLLYAMTFTIKMSKMGEVNLPGYYEYVVPPLEGFWEVEPLDLSDREQWRWTSVIRQPEFVTCNSYEWALKEVGDKKPELDTNRIRFESFTEGLCVQMMHVGPYSEEAATILKLHEFIEENDLENDSGNYGRFHHEIYLGDPRRTKPENLKTILRLPVKRK